MNRLRMSQLLFHYTYVVLVSLLVGNRTVTMTAAAAALADVVGDDDGSQQRMMCVQQMSTHNKSLLATEILFKSCAH